MPRILLQPASLPLSRLLAFAVARLRRAVERRRQRVHLSELDRHLLDDIGLTPHDVRRECTKSWFVGTPPPC